jgi:hypothetical protein
MKKTIARRQYKRQPDEAAENGILTGLMVGLVILGAFLVFLAATQTSREGFSQVFLNEKQFSPKAQVGQPFYFSFTVENHEGREAVYAYEVSVGTQLVARKKLLLADEQAFVVSEKVPALAYGSYRVNVRVFRDNAAEPLSLFFPLDVR